MEEDQMDRRIGESWAGLALSALLLAERQTG